MADEGRTRDELLKEIEELRRQEERYRALFDNSPELIYVHDLEGRFLDASSRALSLLGYTRDEIGALTFTDLLQEEDVPRALESTRRIVEDGSADSVQQYRLRAKDGGHVWAETSGVRLVKDGVPYAVLGFARDITDRKQAEEALRKSEEWYRALIQSSSVAYDVVDTEGNVSYASPSVERMFGWTPEEIKAQSIFALVHPDDVERAVAEFRELVMNPGQVRTVDIRYRHKDGSWRDIHVSGVNMAEDPTVGGIVLTSHDVTERKRAEEALRRISEEQRTILDSVPAAIWYKDTKNRILRVNKAAATAVGLPVEEIEGKTAYELFPGMADKYLADDLEVIDAGKAKVGIVEQMTVPTTGETRWVRTDKVPYLNENGGIAGVIAFVVDITDRKRAEEAMQTLIKAAAGSVGKEFFADITTSLCDWLDVDCAIVGEIADESRVNVLSMRVDDRFVPHYSYALLGTPCDEVARRGYCVYSEEVATLFPNDEELLSMGAQGYVGIPLRDKSGHPLGVLCAISRRKLSLPPQAKEVMEIIGARAAAEIERERAEEEIKNLARFPSENPSPVLRVAADGTILYANLASRPLLDEWKSSEGQPVPEDIGRHVADARRSGEDRVADVAARDRLYSFVFAPVPDADYVNMYGRDVTEHRTLEEHHRHAQKMEAIGLLAGGIAHDFNNLLQGILGYANLLKLRSKERDKTYEAADVIERAGTRAAELTQQLLGFARKGKLRDTPVDVHRTIGEAVAILTRTIDKRIAMVQRLKAEPCVVKGDPGQLQQVVMNLAVNARDAMLEGGELTFETSLVDYEEGCCELPPDATQGKYLLLSVSDTGVGMTPEVRERVFEPFYSTKPQGEGTGMGLAMVYGIVRNHGGCVVVHSDPGKGTTFDIYLPVAEKSARITDSQKLKAVMRGSGRVLVVDDEETVRDILTEMLKVLGYEVRCACDGQEAVEHYREHASEIDLVVLDMTMPVMDGRECFEELQKIDPGVKAVLATGHSLNGTAQGIMDAGVLRFIHKPFIMAELAETVAKALAR